jgi:guanyl-specific ribonuclease Sa
MPLSLNGSGGITYPDGTVNTTRSVSTAGDTMTGPLSVPSITGLTAGAGIAAAALSGRVARANATLGSVLQVVQATNGNVFSTTTKAAVATGLSASITPTSSSSKILVVVQGNGRATGPGNCYFMPSLFRNSTEIYDLFAQGGNFNNSSDIRTPISIVFMDSPATTSSTTYQLYLDSTYATSVQLNDVSGTSSITLMEIAA